MARSVIARSSRKAMAAAIANASDTVTGAVDTVAINEDQTMPTATATDTATLANMIGEASKPATVTDDSATPLATVPAPLMSNRIMSRDALITDLSALLAQLGELEDKHGALQNPMAYLVAMAAENYRATHKVETDETTLPDLARQHVLYFRYKEKLITFANKNPSGSELERRELRATMRFRAEYAAATCGQFYSPVEMSNDPGKKEIGEARNRNYNRLVRGHSVVMAAAYTGGASLDHYDVDAQLWSFPRACYLPPDVYGWTEDAKVPALVPMIAGKWLSYKKLESGGYENVQTSADHIITNGLAHVDAANKREVAARLAKQKEEEDKTAREAKAASDEAAKRAPGGQTNQQDAARPVVHGDETATPTTAPPATPPVGVASASQSAILPTPTVEKLAATSDRLQLIKQFDNRLVLLMEVVNHRDFGKLKLTELGTNAFNNWNVLRKIMATVTKNDEAKEAPTKDNAAA